MSKRKNISIDEEAFKLLKSNKRKDETWSDVIKKRIFEPLSGSELSGAVANAYARDRRHAKAR